MAEGEFALMQQHVNAALEKRASTGATRGSDQELYALLVDAAVQQRDQASLQKYAPLAEETAEQMDHKLHIGIAQRAWGVAHTLAGEYAQAEGRLQKALEIFSAYPAPWQIGRTQFEMGELARARGEKEQARDHFSRALRAFEQLHAAPYSTRTHLALEELSRA